MSKLTLNLSKPGDVKERLSLNLVKDENFIVKLKWDGATDLDLHALACFGPAGAQPAVTAFEQILSTYNLKRVIGGQEQGTLTKAADGTFSILDGALTHSPDATDGHAGGDDEWIRINPGKLVYAPGTVIEIPLVAMIHPQTKGATFSQVQNPEVSIEKTTGEVLLQANLSQQFGAFVGVHMGSVMIDQTGKVEFLQTASGFATDFNSVIANFS